MIRSPIPGGSGLASLPTATRTDSPDLDSPQPEKHPGSCTYGGDARSSANWARPGRQPAGVHLAGSQAARIVGGEFSAPFTLSLALKDLHLALQAAGDNRFAALACVAGEWQQAVDQGLGRQDLTIVTRVLAQQGGRP
jgi:hypothetical protein